MKSQPGPSVAEIRDKIRAAGLRSTVCRVAVLQHLWGSRQPRSHADVAEVLVPEGFDKSTLFRCLTEMADAGLLSRLDVGDHVWRFELRHGKTTDGAAEHPHFLCVDCGQVSCLDDVKLKVGPPRKGRKVASLDVTEVLLKGHCGTCQ